ncbi:MAG: DNA cytosine methyltransferase [bacterium]|nr:DNA cytosine methyltransferase [bacterium]
MNYLDLFSGIGGFRLGAEWAGMKFDKEYHSDIDEYANKVYAQHFPKSKQLGDITKIDFEKLKDGNEFLISGGFPCQDISIAGKGEGIEGKRSGLWSEMWRAIRVLRPRFAIIENVSAITFRGLDRVLADLAEIGYSAEWQDIRAEDVDAPHRRERIWIVAYPEQARWRERANGERIGFAMQGRREASNNLSDSGEAQGIMAYPSEQGLEGQEPEGRDRGQQGLLTERSQWPVEPSICRVVNGLPNRSHRLRCLGNSIVPQIAQLLFEQIKEEI